MKQEESKPKPRILVAPLDWGLGHATRCIPVIRALLHNNCTVLLAGNGKIASLLKTEFPALQLLPLNGYNINYAQSGIGTLAAIMRQIPKLKKAIAYENEWLKKVVEEHKIDAVISDNRYGLYHPQIHSVFITHQLLIKTPFGKFADRFLQRMNYKRIQQFNECWVPDAAEEPNLGGALSHPATMPIIDTTYIGALTRFQPTEEILTSYILILLSGPEPQRTLLEESLLKELKDYKEPVFFIRGLPGNTTLPKIPYHVNIANHLSTNVLQLALQNASFVIARSGYSTVMDVMALHKQCILIPTPGQSEQVYLAKHLMQNRLAFCVPQKKFGLHKTIELAKHFRYQLPEKATTDCLQPAIEKLLQHVKKQKGF